MFIATSSIPNDGTQENIEIRRQKLKMVLQLLPVNHYKILGLLCHFLNKVSKNSGENKMTVYNLAVVFAPNVLKTDKQLSPDEYMKDSKYSNDLMTDFIQDAHLFFPGGDQMTQSAVDEQLNKFLNGITSDSPPPSPTASPSISNIQSQFVKRPSTKERFKQRRASEVSDGQQQVTTKMAGSSVVLRKKLSLPVLKAETITTSPTISAIPSSPRVVKSPPLATVKVSTKTEPAVDEEEDVTTFIQQMDSNNEEHLLKFMKLRFTIGQVDEEEVSYLLSLSDMEIDFSDPEIYERLYMNM
jgi:hypothetical protein